MTGEGSQDLVRREGFPEEVTFERGEEERARWRDSQRTEDSTS